MHAPKRGHTLPPFSSKQLSNSGTHQRNFQVEAAGKANVARSKARTDDCVRVANPQGILHFQVKYLASQWRHVELNNYKRNDLADIYFVMFLIRPCFLNPPPWRFSNFFEIPSVGVFGFVSFLPWEFQSLFDLPSIEVCVASSTSVP